MPQNTNKMCVALCHRFRLRKKTWKNPGTVFLDYHVYEEDINISSNWEVFLEVLEGEDPGQHGCHYYSSINGPYIMSFIDFSCRTRADEVYVPVGGSDPPLVPSPDEAGGLPGGGAGEQQCRGAQGEGLWNMTLC